MSGTEKKGRARAIEQLKKFVRSEDWTEGGMGDAVANETDRGAIIILASAIDDILAQVIEARFVKLSKDETSRLFGVDAPIGTFSARIRIAYALGIIDRDIQKMCDIIREMRNACAHSKRQLSFSDAPLFDLLQVLWGKISRDDLSDAHAATRRLVFGWVCMFLSRAIRTGSKEEATSLVQAQVNDFWGSVKREAQGDQPSDQTSP